MAGEIAKFVRSTAWQRRLWFGLADFATHGFVVCCLYYICRLFFPEHGGLAIAVGITWLVTVVLYSVLRKGFSLRGADRDLHLQDRLITWWGLRDKRSDALMDWLERDLTSSLGDLPAQRREILWRRPLRRVLRRQAA